MKFEDIKKIVVLMGGTSSEKEISIRSGQNVSDSLLMSGYQVIEVDTEFVEIPKDADFAYIALHGEGGEDGTIQSKLEKMGLPYSGSGVEASAIAFDKLKTKRMLEAQNIPTPIYVKLESVEDLSQIKEYPIIIKPALEGSSIGIEIADNAEEAVEKFSKLSEDYGHLFSESFITGKELTVSVIGERVLPVLELVPKNRFYDFEAKYTKGMTEFVLPAVLNEADEELVKKIAKHAYDAVGCRGAVRVDIMLDAKKGPFVLELNTSPGMTETSDLPAQAQAAGIEIDELITLIMKESVC